jgi:error-prone DNA polymerase
MLPRLKPQTFYDLVVQVAIVRPGPIQGDMVHPYLRRREGKEAGRISDAGTGGCARQDAGSAIVSRIAMKVAMVCAGFTGGEADQLRKLMATFKFTGGVSGSRTSWSRAWSRTATRGVCREDVQQLEGFGSYGFPESHAASFALIAYASSYHQMPLSGCVLCRLLNPADGLLRAGPDRRMTPRTTASKSGPSASIARAGIARSNAIGKERPSCGPSGNAAGQGTGRTVDAARIVAARMNDPFESSTICGGDRACRRRL